MSEEYSNYHKFRGNDYNEKGWIHNCIIEHLPLDKNASILDIGCGGGEMLLALKDLGYSNLMGIDLDESAVQWVLSNGIYCENKNVLEFVPKERFDFILINHVLEHIPKSEVVKSLKYIYTNLLNEGGKLYIGVPNAQSSAGCYWAYEDFTHETLYTSGSISYVLKCAGFEKIDFLDKDGLYDFKGISKWLLKFLLYLYDKRVIFYNKVTRSFFHKPSPRIYTWELKVLAQK